MNLKILALAVLILSGCATGSKTVMTSEKISEPKIIALSAPRTPWTVEIENRLRQRGFKVLRWASTKKVTEMTSETRKEEFKEASTRYVLFIDGYAPMDQMHRCFGGGYNFDFITADLVDVNSNETLLNVSGSGYSENCPPMSGSIYNDIVDTVSNAWK